MIQSVYIAKDLDQLKYLIKKDYQEVHFIDCSDLPFEDFIRKHNPSLFQSSECIKCFLKVDSYKKELLLPILDSLQVKAVWGFVKLPKTYKVYKQLSKMCKITHGLDLTKESNKTALIKEILSKHGLSTKYSSSIKDNVPSNPSIIEQEIKKFSHAIEVLGEDKAHEVLCTYNTNKDVLNLISSLLDGDLPRYYDLAIKVARGVPVLIVHATVLKKLKAMIFLSIGRIDEANKFWRSSGYFLQNDLRLAKRLGFKYLVDLYSKTDEVLGNIYDEKDAFTRICSLGYYHCRATKTLR